MLSAGGVGNRATRRALSHRVLRLMNHDSGEVVEVDERVSRVKRMRRVVRGWSQCMELIQRRLRLVHICLTFANPDGWYPECVSEYMDALVKHCDGRLIGAAWVAEIQDGSRGGVARGAVHYHIIAAVLPGTDIPTPDRSGMWSHGSSSIGSAWSVWYLLKYTQKIGQKGAGTSFDFPRGLRLYAVTRRQLRYIAADLVEQARYFMKSAHTPVWVLRQCHSRDEVMSACHCSGGWRVGDHVLKTPWTVLSMGWESAG